MVQWSFLDTYIDDLRAAAVDASRKAYCPYSNFPVGAAILTADGQVFSGCNVENASLGLSICAERNAIFQAIACGQKHIRALVVYTPTAIPTAPCGACRQVLSEIAPEAAVRCICDGPDVLDRAMSELMTDVYGPRNLGIQL